MVARNIGEKVQFLVGRRFPDYWRQHKMETSDPRITAIREYEDELANLPDRDLDERYIQAVDEDTRKQAASAERADRLEFFLQLDAGADFRFWCSLETWSLDEAAALLLEKDPAKVSSSSLHYVRHESPFRRSFESLKGKLQRAVHDGKLRERDKPATLFAWAEKTGVVVPAELSARLASADYIEGRERTSMLKIIIGMAQKHYGYEPGDVRSDVPTKIANDLDGRWGLTPKTIKKYLYLGSTFLPAHGNKKDLR